MRQVTPIQLQIGCYSPRSRQFAILSAGYFFEFFSCIGYIVRCAVWFFVLFFHHGWHFQRISHSRQISKKKALKFMTGNTHEAGLGLAALLRKLKQSLLYEGTVAGILVTQDNKARVRFAP